MPIREPTFRPLPTRTGHAHVEGTALPHAKVEIENVTVKAERGHASSSTFQADAQGNFSGSLPLSEGDFVRLRTVGPQGPSSWLTVRSAGLNAVDTQNARLDVFALQMAASSNGITIASRNGAPLSEPGATISFTNVTNGNSTKVTLDDHGRIPADVTMLNGNVGDEIHVAISDGRNNAGFGLTTLITNATDGTRDTNVVDPAPLAKDRNATTTRFTGPLFVDEPRATDVQQGSIGNCYVPAAFAALAHTAPEALKSMIRENGDGTYTVRFFDTSWVPAPRQVLIDVDGDLYARGSRLQYGKTLSSETAPDKMELWFPILEKAYAAFRGSYEVVGQGGAGGKVMSNVLGGYDDYTDMSQTAPDEVWTKLKSAVDNGHPTTAGTHGSAESHRFTNSGVYANHAYSVLGAREENGQRYVTVRNPWGSSEAGNDGKNDGIFDLPFEKFANLFVALASVPVP